MYESGKMGVLEENTHIFQQPSQHFTCAYKSLQKPAGHLTYVAAEKKRTAGRLLPGHNGASGEDSIELCARKEGLILPVAARPSIHIYGCKDPGPKKRKQKKA
jgi:hypothetical protein